MSVIQAGNTTTTSLIYTGDTTGNLVFTTGGANTVALTIDSTQNISTTNKFASASMPTGSVLQVVQGTYSTSTSSSSSAYADTGLTASITPKFSTSKVLVIVNQNGCQKINDTGINIKLLNGSTTLATFGVFTAGTSSAAEMDVGSSVFTYLDSPATTSSVTYKTQFISRSNIPSVTVQYLSVTSSITLMEIAG